MSERESITKITGKTLVPISVVVALVGGSGWLTKQNHMAEANAIRIQEIKIELQQKDDVLNHINENLFQIKTDIGFIKGKISNEKLTANK